MSREIARDLGQHLQQQIGEVVVRHIRSAEPLLEQTDLLVMFAEAAVSVALSAAASTANSVKPDAANDAFDATLDVITKMIQSQRGRALAEVARQR